MCSPVFSHFDLTDAGGRTHGKEISSAQENLSKKILARKLNIFSIVRLHRRKRRPSCIARLQMLWFVWLQESLSVSGFLGEFDRECQQRVSSFQNYPSLAADSPVETPGQFPRPKPPGSDPISFAQCHAYQSICRPLHICSTSPVSKKGRVGRRNSSNYTNSYCSAIHRKNYQKLYPSSHMPLVEQIGGDDGFK